MKKLFYSMMVLGAMMSCTAPKSDAPACNAEAEAADSAQVNVSLVGGEWTVVSVLGNEVKVNTDAMPLFMFNANDTVNGGTGCNRFFGAYKLAGDSLSFGDVASTKMMCPDMAVEDSLLKAIQQVVTYSIADSTLSMKNADNQEVIVCTQKAIK
ncbi:MAG: META domain-containing protein [Paludibacteraceae bacterium]|nr:META domain-containing protein [Paludibacteraceae bacterium]